VLIQPLHIATRGRLDGEYGIATRGYIVLPDIVPAFPSGGYVEDGWVIGIIDDLDLEAVVEEHAVFSLQAAVYEDAELDALVAADSDLVAVVEDEDPGC